MNKHIYRIWKFLFKKTCGTQWYPYIYPSYWHAYMQKSTDINSQNYFSACPNRGAGIGHQWANYNSGVYYAQLFGLRYAHYPFPNKDWEDFFGFGLDTITVYQLVAKGYKRVRLPLFDEHNSAEIEMIKRIIASYNNTKTLFIAEQDQPYFAQYDVIPYLKNAFYASPARVNDLTPYSKSNFNIAVHVRRGDITVGQTNKNPNLLMRWQNIDYFVNVLQNIISNLSTKRSIHIYIFSQGRKESFFEFDRFNNVHYHLNMNQWNTMAAFIYADLLITSKSSFSYKPALIQNGIKVCPFDFWHGYPDEKQWILMDSAGNFMHKTHAIMQLRNIDDVSASRI